jgi:hypothetical protein
MNTFGRIKNSVFSFFKDLVKVIIVLLLLAIVIEIIILMASLIINSISASPELAVAYGTVSLAMITGILAYVTYHNAENEKRIKFIEKRLEEFYNPIIYYLSSSNVSREDFYALNELLIKKRYLANPKTLDEIPTTFPEKNVVLPPKRNPSNVYPDTLDGWFFHPSKRYYLNKWKKAYDIIIKDRELLINDYKKMHGAKKDITSTSYLQSNLKVNRMRDIPKSISRLTGALS